MIPSNYDERRKYILYCAKQIAQAQVIIGRAKTTTQWRRARFLAERWSQRYTNAIMHFRGKPSTHRWSPKKFDEDAYWSRTDSTEVVDWSKASTVTFPELKPSFSRL